MSGQCGFHGLPGKADTAPADPDDRNQSPRDKALNASTFELQLFSQVVLREQVFAIGGSAVAWVRVLIRSHAFGNVPTRYEQPFDFS